MEEDNAKGWSRVCPECEKDGTESIIYYKSKRHCDRAEREGTKCIKCAHNLLKKWGSEQEGRRERKKRWRESCRERRRNGNLDTLIMIRCHQIKSRSKVKGIKYDLTKEYLEGLYYRQGGKCYYTGTKMVMSHTAGLNTMDMDGIYSMSLDRINRFGGYVKGNVVWCTIWANQARSIWGDEVLYQMCGKVYRWMGKKRKKKTDTAQMG
jgi:hypothetical protein